MHTPKRILLVEDEEAIAEMLSILFEAQGYVFLHAANGAEALEICQKNMPHLILMDIVLPDMDGFAVCQHLREQPRTAYMPIIFLTRRDQRENRIRALDLGADDFIAKPFDLEELLLRVRNVLDRAEQKHLVDSASGLPGAFVARDYIAHARANPDLAIIEISIHHCTPYYNFYGEAALQEVQAYLGQLILWSIKQADITNGFAGNIDEDEFVVVCPAKHARQISDRITTIFNFNVGRYYADADREQGALWLDEQQYPLMTVTCRVHYAQPNSAVS